MQFDGKWILIPKHQYDKEFASQYGNTQEGSDNILLLWVWSKALNGFLATELTASWYTWFIFPKYKLIKEVTEMKSIS